MDHRVLPGLLFALVAGPAAAAEPSLDDLRRGSERARGIVAACEARPMGCADPEARAALARSFYTLAVAALVNGEAVDPAVIANIAILDPSLLGALPDPPAGGEAASWVHRLAQVEGPPADRVVQVPAAPPIPEIVDVQPEIVPATAMERARIDVTAGRDHDATARLLPIVESDPHASPLLSTALERMGLPAAALLMRLRWLSRPTTHPDLARDGTRDAVRLAMVVGSRRPLIELAEALPPTQWHPSVASDGWLALGESWRLRGDLSPALKAFSAIEATSPAYARGEYLTGIIYLQTGQPWEALGAFGNAWEARAEDIDVDRIREMALWQSAGLYAHLQRPAEAHARFEVLAIERSPLSDRAAHRCAWIAHGMGDADLARGWLSSTPGDGVFAPDDQLLRARIALLAADRAAARRHLNGAQPGLEALRKELQSLTGDLGNLWSRLHAPDRNRTLEARLHADPEVAALRAHLSALRADRRALAAVDDPEWRATAGRQLDALLLAEEQRVRSQATATAYAAVIDVQRELQELARDATRLRLQVED